MIQPQHFLQQLAETGVEFFTGVPDSLLKGLLTTISGLEKNHHIIAVNEGAAIGLAAGYHFATGKMPAVYLQNSGLGNMVNPLTSLASSNVYGVPILLIIGWRGEPGMIDEPQHLVMGKITPALLHQLHVPFFVLKKDDGQEWKDAVNEAIFLGINEQRPVALLVEPGFFPEGTVKNISPYEMDAEDAIRQVYETLTGEDVVICTTGKIGRLFYEINKENQKIKKYFLNVGSMGHALSVATGLALHIPDRVFLFDGDGALLMHMGALALPPSLTLHNLFYVLLNNGAHASVGAQPTLGFEVNFCTIARGCGFKNPVCADTTASLRALLLAPEPFDFLEVRIDTRMRDSLQRPAEAPRQAKEIFMHALQNKTK